MTGEERAPPRNALEEFLASAFVRVVLGFILTGPEWLTGGSFGPEGSLVTLAVTTAASAAPLVVVWRRAGLRRPRLRSSGGGGRGRA